MDVLERSAAMFIVFSAFDIGRNIYKGYVEKHPELSEASEQRTRHKQAERIEAAPCFRLVRGRLSQEECDRPYVEKATGRYADYEPAAKEDTEKAKRA